MLQVMPRVEERVSRLHLGSEGVNRLDVIGDLSDPQVIRLASRLVQVLGEG